MAVKCSRVDVGNMECIASFLISMEVRCFSLRNSPPPRIVDVDWRYRLLAMVDELRLSVVAVVDVELLVRRCRNDEELDDVGRGLRPSVELDRL